MINPALDTYLMDGPELLLVTVPLNGGLLEFEAPNILGSFSSPSTRTSAMPLLRRRGTISKRWIKLGAGAVLMKGKRCLPQYAIGRGSEVAMRQDYL